MLEVKFAIVAVGRFGWLVVVCMLRPASWEEAMPRPTPKPQAQSHFHEPVHIGGGYQFAASPSTVLSTSQTTMEDGCRSAKPRGVFGTLN